MTHGDGGQIYPKNLWLAARLGPLSGECVHADCTDDAEEYVIFQSVEQVRSYCEHHAGRARQHFFQDGLTESDAGA